MPDQQVRDYALWCVSKALVQESRYPEAIEIASMIFAQEHRSGILIGICEALAKEGRFPVSEVIEFASMIPDQRLRSLALKQINEDEEKTLR